MSTVDGAVERILSTTRTIAMVGASDDASRPSHGVARSLLAAGFRLLPVTPTRASVLGIPTVASLEELDEPVDLVNVFRRAEHAPAIAEQAVAIGSKGLWLQSGIRSARARAIAEQAGLAYVEDACLGVLVSINHAGPVPHADGARGAGA